jgi:thymidylate synthase
MDRAIDNLNEEAYNLTKGDLIWQVMNLHVYSRHFDLVV